MKIAIIGAGLSGSYMYKLLKEHGHDVTVFEKSRGAGGRFSTRFIKDKFVDHGTQSFKASDEEFYGLCTDLQKQGLLENVDNEFLPTRGMHKICSSMIQDYDLIRNSKIASLKYTINKWILKDDKGHSYGGFHKLIITIPAAQVLEIDFSFPKIIKEKLQQVTYNSIASLMFYSDSHDEFLSSYSQSLESNQFSVTNNSARYNYQTFSSYVVQLAQNDLNYHHFISKEHIGAYMLEQINKIVAQDLQNRYTISPHLWKYARVVQNIDDDFLYCNPLSLGICGDYFLNTDAQGAFLSTRKLHQEMFEFLEVSSA